jgi:hypothetical protein
MCDPGTAMELSEYFTFMVPGAKHMHLYKIKKWDGKIRFLNYNGTFFIGIFHRLLHYVKNDDIYDIDIDPKFLVLNSKNKEEVKIDFKSKIEENTENNSKSYPSKMRPGFPTSRDVMETKIIKNLINSYFLLHNSKKMKLINLIIEF